MLRKLRILLLLWVLVMVAASGWLTRQRATDWQQPLHVVVYPINGDRSAVARAYIGRLTAETYTPIAAYLSAQAADYGVPLADVVDIDLAPEVLSTPPLPPRGGLLQVAAWSLKLRYWAWRNNSYPGPAPDVRLYVLYFDPDTSPRLRHSLGLEKGMIGVIHAFASRRLEGSNQVVMTHELLHTLGATDKYDPATNLPIHPIGYADPARWPLFPQAQAELMGGRVPISESKAEIPRSLDETRIGPVTAHEINWLADPAAARESL